MLHRRSFIFIALSATVLGAVALALWRLPSRGSHPEGHPPPNPPVHVVYVQHEGEENGRKVAAVIAEAAARARAHGERLAFVMEWAGPKRTWEDWQAADVTLQGISKEAFLALSIVQAAMSNDGAVRMRTVLDSWVRWRDAVLDGTQRSWTIGPDANAFAKEVNGALHSASDVIAEWWIEGSWAQDVQDPRDKLDRDMEILGLWLPAYQYLQISQLLNNNELIRALDLGDAQRFRVQGRRGLVAHRESMRWRNRTMLVTLTSLRDRHRADPALKAITVYGLAHAGLPVLREGLGADVVETIIDPIVGPMDRMLQVYSDPESYFCHGDGSDAERHAIGRLIQPAAPLLDRVYLADRDGLLSELTPPLIDGFIASMRGFKSTPPERRQDLLKRSLVEFIAAHHPDASAGERARAFGRNWLGIR
jgi:hypothetical protein